MSYMNATRVEYDGTGWDCPAQMTPCSTNTTLGGSTVCIDSLQTCPITDILLLMGDSTDYRLNDASYTK